MKNQNENWHVHVMKVNVHKSVVTFLHISVHVISCVSALKKGKPPNYDRELQKTLLHLQDHSHEV